MEFFEKSVTCRRTNGIKFNKYPNFMSRDPFVDAYGLHVGSQYHIDQLHYCSINGPVLGNVGLDLVTLKEFPNDLYLRSGFLE
jgi:hypothetical protein